MTVTEADRLRQERDTAVALVRDILEQVSQSIGIPLNENGQPKTNAYLFRQIGQVLECHDWDWPSAPNVFDPDDRDRDGHYNHFGGPEGWGEHE